MKASNGRIVNKDYTTLKVVLNRIPFGDRTNNSPMPVTPKCDGKDLKTKSNKSCTSRIGTKQNSKQQKQLKTVTSSIRSEKNKNECVSRKPVEVSTHTVPEISKNFRVVLERTNFSQRLQKKDAHADDGMEKSLTRSSTPLVKRLRKCEDRNYFESPSECSTYQPSNREIKNATTSELKIPIYKQNIIEESKQNEKDPYELDISDIDKEKPKKKPRNLNNSRKFDKTMYDLLEKLDKKEKRDVKKNILAPSNHQKYSEKVNGVVKKIMSKVNDRKKNASKVTKMNVVKNPISEVLNQRNKNGVEDGFLGYENSNIQPIKKLPGYKNHHKIKTLPPQEQIKKATTREKEKTKEKPLFIESIQGYEDEDGFLGFDNENIRVNEQKSDQTNKKINIVSVVNIRPEEPLPQCVDQQSECHSNDHCTEQYFGFADENDDFAELPPPKTLESPVFFSRRPNANSTMIGGFSQSPWRLSIPGKRNNHFLLYKNNSLPSMNQDMVLDHSLVEESVQISKSRCNQVSRPKSPLQSSILDFVEGSSDHHLNRNQDSTRRSSLFDYEDFIVTKPRRKVLGVLQEKELARKQTESTPRREPQSQISSPETSTLDGFDKGQENKKPSGKPFRIDLRELRQYKRNAEVKDVAELPTTDETVIEPLESTGKQGETVVEDVQLFEDFDSKQEMEMTIKLPTMKYERKRQRKRLLSNACDETNEEKPKKKKDMMTKAELDAYEKWAQEFNSMCKEVDEHHLEIE